MKNKIGATNVWLPVILIVLVVGLVGVGYLAVKQEAFTGGANEVNPNTGVPVPDTGCSVNPTITVAAVDALQPGSAVTVGSDYLINGQYSTASTGIRKGDKVTIRIGAANYINKTLPELTVQCGANPVNAQIYSAATTPTVVIKNDAGLAQLSDSAVGGATNETVFAAGGSKNFAIEVTGTDKKSTGDRIVVFEFASEANVSSMTLTDANTGLQMTKLSSVPSGTTVSGTNQYRAAFMVPSVDGAVKKTYNLNVQATTGNIPQGAFYSTFYISQAYVDTDGQFKVGIANSNSVLVNVANYDYDFLVASA